MGNLWVWPGSHRAGAAYLREHGPDALLEIAHPAYPMAAPQRVVGRAGDLYLAHYLLGHNMGGNLSSEVRRVVYFSVEERCPSRSLVRLRPRRASRIRAGASGRGRAGRGRAQVRSLYAASKKESSRATARPKKSRHGSACAGPTRSNSARRKSTKPRKFGLSCSVIHSACTKLFGSGCGAREAQSR
jgi:hypothetical protein